MSIEQAVLFHCEGESLVGVLSLPNALTEGMTGVLVVVGGPQYRVGSHRQFVLLARYLAQNGVPCLRFDYRGMGDSTGEQRDFEQVGADIRAAIEVFFANAPGLGRVVLWGLCDGASAISMTLAEGDRRVAGAVLLNPWVRTEAGEAQTILKHYYLRRLLDPSFWSNFFSGRINIRLAFRGVKDVASRAGRRPGSRGNGIAVPQRMLAGLAKAPLPLCICLSGRDYVAKEFDGLVRHDPGWRALTARVDTSILRFADADHTFSETAARLEVEQATLYWLKQYSLSPS